MDFITKQLSKLFTQDPVFQSLFSSFQNYFHAFHFSRAFHIPQSFLLLVVAAFLFFTLFFLLFHVLRMFLLVQMQLRHSFILLELKPPRKTLQSAYTTQQLFTLIHGLAKPSTWFQRVIGYSKSYAFEIVSSKEQGIRYLVRVHEEDVDILKKGLFSYLPGISVNQTPDYVSNSSNSDKIICSEFSLRNHFAFPLKRQNDLEEHDPIAYMTGSMTKLAPGETVAFQLIAAPLNKNWVKDIKRISQLIYKNADLVEGLRQSQNTSFLSVVLRFVVRMLLRILLLPVGIIVFALSESHEGPFLPLPFERNKEKTINPYQTELELTVKGKLDQQLFTVSLRLAVIGNTSESGKRKRGFAASLSSFTNSYQSLKIIHTFQFSSIQKLKVFTLRHRLLSFFDHSILSISEVSDLYHFPFTSRTHTEDIQKVHSTELPAPVSLKKSTDLDVIFAKNTYGGTITDIGLNAEERRRHMYILGATGTGKSTMLLSMIKQDMEHGKGLCVIDPHGELIENILPLVPEHRMKDVIHFNPDDISFPMGLNVLELPADVTGDGLLREKELIAESIISLFHKVWGEQYSGPRMEYILRNTIHTAFLIPNATLFTVYKLLINEDYRNKITSKITDESLHDFWKYEFSKAGDYQVVSMISPITNKIGRFLFSPISKRILEQEKSTINFEHIMDSGKILLCNVSKGKIGEDNSQVFGALIMTKIQLAALKRARQKSATRKDFYLYVDEFQNFATPSFAQILSEARKYRLNAILAHQTTSQLEDKSLVNVTLANTGTIICFRTANPEDERLILPQFLPYVQTGEIDNLPSFHFYIKISALRPEEPFSGETIQLMVPTNEEYVQRIIQASRDHFTKEFVALPHTDGHIEAVKDEKTVRKRQTRGFFPKR